MLDLESARQAFEDSTDFTIGIEEEFQILDGATRDMTNRFEELRDACEAGPLHGNVAILSSTNSASVFPDRQIRSNTNSHGIMPLSQ